MTPHILVFFNSRKHTGNLIRESNSLHKRKKRDNENIFLHDIRLKTEMFMCIFFYYNEMNTCDNGHLEAQIR